MRKVLLLVGLAFVLQGGSLALPLVNAPVFQTISRVEAGDPNCVDEVKADGYWGRHFQDAFAGASYARDFASKAASRGWVVDSKPEVGDVVVWQGNAGGAFASGHVALAVAVRGNAITVREQNWGSSPSAPGSIRDGVQVVSGMSFVHRRKAVTTFREERYQSGTRSERYQSGTRSERYQSGTRSERYQCGWNDRRVFRNGKWVNERTPKQCTRTVPVYSTRTVSVYSTRTVALYSTRTVPVYSTRTVPIYSTRTVPVYSTRKVPTGTSIQNMP